MKTINYQKVLGGISVLILILAIGYMYTHKSEPTTKQSEGKTYIFTCKNQKSVTATFYPNSDTHIDLTLSDGRTLALLHAISGSGARYTNSDESFVFWNKGLTAFITEGKDANEKTTYEDCVTGGEAEATTTEPGTKNIPPEKPVVVTPPIKTNLSTYSNSEYTFQIQFPKTVTSQNFFTTFYNLPSNWRMNPSAANQGKSIVSFPIYRIDQGGIATGKNYPLFFVAELRIGVSPNTKACYELDSSYSNQKAIDVSINGVPFKRFDFEDAAMMKYVKGSSYRTIHNNICYVLEQIKAGSSYKDDTMKTGLSEATLNSYYDQAGVILKTFKFTK